MIEIKKGNEPDELITYRLRKDLNPSYSGMSGAKVSQFIEGGSDDNLYQIVINSLAKEQGYICAYCMRRIPQKKVRPQMTIEHVDPQHNTDEDQALNYRNMVAVCNGNRNASDNKYKTCDAKRGALLSSKQTLYVNPLDSSSLRNLYYMENGEIHSHDRDQDECIKDVLNLNCEYLQLPDARKSALNALQQKIRQDYPNRTAPKTYFQELLDHFQAQETKTPYVGILISWLETKV